MHRRARIQYAMNKTNKQTYKAANARSYRVPQVDGPIGVFEPGPRVVLSEQLGHKHVQVAVGVEAGNTGASVGFVHAQDAGGDLHGLVEGLA